MLRIILSSFSTVSYELFHIQKYSSKTTTAAEPGCENYIIFCQDPEVTGAKFGYAIDTRVFIVTIASSWQIREFFNSRVSQNVMNLLVASAGSALEGKHRHVTSYNIQ